MSNGIFTIPDFCSLISVPNTRTRSAISPLAHQLIDERITLNATIPRGKMGRPEENATGALFRASDDASFANGVELSVDGGFSAI
jgi:NAD(P)-dependent dehydrogenase (short-subunit alcohol dehydrogenase family)